MCYYWGQSREDEVEDRAGWKIATGVCPEPPEMEHELEEKENPKIFKLLTRKVFVASGYVKRLRGHLGSALSCTSKDWGEDRGPGSTTMLSN